MAASALSNRQSFGRFFNLYIFKKIKQIDTNPCEVVEPTGRFHFHDVENLFGCHQRGTRRLYHSVNTAEHHVV